MDDRMLRIRDKLDRIRIFQLTNITSKLNNRKLHAQTNSKEWDLRFSRVLDRTNFSFYTSIAKATRH